MPCSCADSFIFSREIRICMMAAATLTAIVAMMIRIDGTTRAGANRMISVI